MLRGPELNNSNDSLSPSQLDNHLDLLMWLLLDLDLLLPDLDVLERVVLDLLGAALLVVDGVALVLSQLRLRDPLDKNT